MKRSNSAWSAANALAPSSRASEQWMWHELPSRSLNFAMKVIDMLLLGGDLLGAVLVDRVVVGAAQRVRVAEVDLVLAEVALALRVLDRHPGRRHLVADPPDQRLDPRRCPAASSRCCRGWPARGRGSPSSRPPRRCRWKTMNSSSVPALALSPRSARRASWRRRIWRGEATTSRAVVPLQVGHQHHRRPRATAPAAASSRSGTISKSP